MTPLKIPGRTAPACLLSSLTNGALTDGLLPFSIAQNSIPLVLTLRQSDLYWSFQLAPSKAWVQSATKGAETAI